MKHLLSFVAFLTVCFLLSPAEAQDKVVVIPLNSAKKLSKVVTVSAQGGDFTDPVAAVNSITDATATNPYLVLIGPGVYRLGGGSLQMKPFVDIQGSGENTTRIVGSIDSRTSGVVRGSDDSELRFVTVENEGGGHYAIAIYNNGSSPRITNVTAMVSGASTHYAVFNQLASPLISNTTIIAKGGQYNYGLFDDNSSSKVTHATVSVSAGAGNNVAVRPIFSDSTITDSQISVIGGGSSENIGINIYGNASTLVNCHISVLSSGGGTHYGVKNTYGDGTRIEHSRIDSVGYGIFCDSLNGEPDTTTVLHSNVKGGYRAVGLEYSIVLAGACRLEGGFNISGGSMSCSGCFDQEMKAITCP